MRRYLWPIAVVLAVAVLVGFVVTGGITGRTSGSDASGDGTSGGGFSGGSDVSVVAPEVGVPDVGDVTEGGKGVDLPVTIGALPLPSGDSLIRYGDLSVVVEVGGFDAALEEANAVATRYGGFVLGSSVSGGERRSGSLTIRVRADDFDLAMRDLRGLGDLERENVSGQDVGMQVVDLEARLAAWTAQREVLLRLLDRASSVADILKVQVELQNVQVNIEQLNAELTYLRDQVALSTITVFLREPGATEGIDDDRRFGDVWELAVQAFLNVIFAMIVGLGYVIPIGVVVAGIVWGVRRYRGRKRR